MKRIVPLKVEMVKIINLPLVDHLENDTISRAQCPFMSLTVWTLSNVTSLCSHDIGPFLASICITMAAVFTKPIVKVLRWPKTEIG